MNVLIVYAHPEPGSFTAAMKDAALAILTEAGHTVEVSDLYREGFNPVPGRHDFTTVADPERFHYQSEQMHASKHGSFAPDIVREQQRAEKAHLMVFLFPLWWGGMPAIMKGWFDRVFAYGFAYADGKRYDSGFFHGRRGLLGIVTGGTENRFSRDGAYGDMGQVLHGVQHCMLEYLGLQVGSPFVAYAAPRVDDDARRQLLKDWQAQLLQALDGAQWKADMLAGAASQIARNQHDALAEQGGWKVAR
jgi:NAD(P)H dehydrogenase (quinone)